MNFDECLEFLRKWKPGGPWILSSIGSDAETFAPNENDLKFISAATFDESNIEEMRKWLERRSGRCSIYFQVNSAVMVDANGNPKTYTKKTTKADIASFDWLHVDLDPRVGKDIREERNKALGILTEPPGNIPKPTCIIFSGGGFQAFWRLKDPVDVKGDIGIAEEAERYNIQLQMILNADACHNADRIMRLPGTINVPNKKKIEKGRQKEQAFVVEFNENEYSTSEFTKAPKLQVAGDELELDETEVMVSGNVKRVSDLQEISNTSGDRVRLPGYVVDLIQAGYDPNAKQVNETRNLPRIYPSRSEALFAVICQLVKKGVPDEVTFSIITDPDYPISESILELKSRAEKHALRQIRRAKDFIISPELEELNQRHCVILSDQGRCVVGTEEYNHVLKRRVLTKSKPLEIVNRYANRQVEIGVKADGTPKFEKLGKWWFENPRRREYKGIVFSPEKEVPYHYNLWRGFAFEPSPEKTCEKFISHIRDNVCSGDDEVFEYLIKWMARTVQFPASQGKVAVVLQGEQGTGKTFFADTFGALFGRHYMMVADSELLLGRFNGHLQDCIVVFSDEAFFAKNPKHQSALKSLITGEFFAVEEKFEKAQMAKNYVHLIMASNSEHVVPADLDERRFLVLKVSNDQKQNPDYFEAIQKEMDDGGYAALLQFLLSVDLSGYIVQNVPKTEALVRQKIISMDDTQKFVYEYLNDPREYQEIVGVKEFFAKYISYCDDQKTRGDRKTKTELQMSMQKMFPGDYPRISRRRIDGRDSSPKMCYEFPPLSEARKSFDKLHHGPFPWNLIDEHGNEELHYEAYEEETEDTPF